MAEPIEMSFKLWTWVGPRNHVLDGVLDLPCEGAILGGMGGPLYSIGTFCHELWKNGCTDVAAVWDVDSGGPRQACIR